MDWLFRAACRAEEPELFFPVGTEGPGLAQTARAKAVCRRCPVMIRCRTWALSTGQVAGVWGGLSEADRRALRHRDRVDLLLPRGLRVADDRTAGGLPTEHEHARRAISESAAPQLFDLRPLVPPTTA